MPTWNSEQYLRFAEERTQPARDLAARIAVASPQRVMDLGCGPGNSTEVLARRWSSAHLEGLDSSTEMIAAARKANPQWQWQQGDIAAWTAAKPYDVVFSNAALQWVPDHAWILPRLLEQVAKGGALAVQMPGNFDAPAHVLMRELGASPAWEKYFRGAVREWHVGNPSFYYDVLAPHATRVDLWTTDYFHIMPNAEVILEWYRGTGLRPWLDALPDEPTRARFAADYLAALRDAYPSQQNGCVLFPFRRLFFVAYR
jgi:trans-aconitate 2-methyltransferase